MRNSVVNKIFDDLNKLGFFSVISGTRESKWVVGGLGGRWAEWQVGWVAGGLGGS